MRKTNSPFLLTPLDSHLMTNSLMKEFFARKDLEFYQHKEKKSNYKRGKIFLN